MKHNYSLNPKAYAFRLLLLLFIFAANLNAQTKAPLRRPISPHQPMWLIHIDTWNYADPQKIIDLIPKDIRPYVVMNISLSISHDVATSRFKVAEYGYEIAKSWTRTCAENGMWTMVQIASGGYAQFSDFDLSVYEEFYRDYPNFIGFNYAEQFWGFDDATDPLSSKWVDRIANFSNLLKLSAKYGGYLSVSWCANQWGQSINPIGMLKRNPKFVEACRQYKDNYILSEKYTQQAYISDVESMCLGAYLSGYSGQYGIRYDDTGWTDATGVNANFTLATAGAPHLEHIMLTGQTVIDGPEIIWTNCFKENNSSTTSDGYTRRSWSSFARFDNVMVDMFRKILDGTVRIPSRKEVIDRTKVVLVANVNSGDGNAIYCSYPTLFEGLYRMDGDGNYENNKTLFKKTGRYPTIPTVYALDDADANSFQIKINKSAYLSRWPSVAKKVTELNTIFPQEYTGDLYAGRNENGWVVYNPYKTGKRAAASIPFKYNTCDHMDLSFAQYTSGVVKEYPNRTTFYLCNYDDQVNTALKADTIKIYGSSVEPTWSYIERGKHKASVITKTWADGVFMLAINHNGAVDITVNCAGTATERLTAYTPATLIAPLEPALYTGPRQYEAECFDRKNISSVVSGGYDGTIRNYTGQGYLVFGTSSAASVRDTVKVLRKGIYKIQIKYVAPTATVNKIDLYVNGIKVATPVFTKTISASDWLVNTQYVTLKEGANVVKLTANATGSASITFDNIIVSQDDNTRTYNFTSDNATSAASSPAAQFVSVKSGSAGVVSYTDGNNQTSNCFKTYSAGTLNGTGVADLSLFPSRASDYYVVWKEYAGSADGKKGILLRASDTNCPYADGLKQGYLFVSRNNSDGTVSLSTQIAGSLGLTDKTSYTSSFKVDQNKPCWCRASARDTNFTFECSTDSVNWVGGTNTAFTDASYSVGSTQLVWGFNSIDFNWMMDDIYCGIPDLSVSKFEINGLGYIYSGTGKTDSINVAATSLKGDVLINSSDNFEISLDGKSGFSASLQLNQVSGVIAQTKFYVRAKSGLSAKTYSGSITIGSTGMTNQTVSLAATIVPMPPVPITKTYNFSNDVATTTATTPPALNTIIVANNGATAGVVSLTDATNNTSNVLKPYTGGNRNATGAIDLNLFSSKSTDYSVVWKEFVTAAKDYKVGVLLRGDATKRGDASTGYVQGIMQGYLFIVNSKATGGSEFRIYKSTSAYNSLSMVANAGITTLIPTTNQPIWYRASVSGSTSVLLKSEYSTDSITWIAGSTYTDTTAPFTSGSTQLVWGLGVGNVDFYVDNVTFYGIEDASTDTKEVFEDNASIVATECYTIAGQRVLNHNDNLKGLFIVRHILSNGKVKASKVIFL